MSFYKGSIGFWVLGFKGQGLGFGVPLKEQGSYDKGLGFSVLSAGTFGFRVDQDPPRAL